MTITYMQEYEKNTWLTVRIHQIVNQDNGLIMTWRKVQSKVTKVQRKIEALLKI
jgi:hypothetical protein